MEHKYGSRLFRECVHNSFMIAERINTPVYLTHNQIFKIKTC
jgi:hypothetical protein